MLAHIHSFFLAGIDAHRCEVEVDLSESGLAKEDIVGLPDAAVRESLDRVRAAIQNSGYPFPVGRLLVNLAPADVRKEGPVYDLPIAVGLLMATGTVNANRIHEGQSANPPLDPRQFLFAGELALDGRVRPVRGIIAMATLARQLGLQGVVAPAENAAEAAVVEGVVTYGVRTLTEIVGLLNGGLNMEPHPPVDVASMIESTPAEVDFAEVRGQEGVKRALTIAAAGGHNILMLGPAGTGKTMMARALPGVLPPLSAEEALDITRIYSAGGHLRTSGSVEGGDWAGLITRRPVRAPHHTVSSAGFIGGGQIPKPGEVSLAHRGVLFLDELPEFPRGILETLRQPLESDSVSISRVHSSVTFPANLMLVAAMNPTSKGDMPTNDASRREMDRYLSRVSGPLIDRIDIHVEAPAVPWKELSAKDARGTSTAEMRECVLRAHEQQVKRQGSVRNARLRGKDLDRLAPMGERAHALLGQAITELGLSARAYDKIRRIARTIADLAGDEALEVGHIAEAVQYRLLDRRV